MSWRIDLSGDDSCRKRFKKASQLGDDSGRSSQYQEFAKNSCKSLALGSSLRRIEPWQSLVMFSPLNTQGMKKAARETANGIGPNAQTDLSVDHELVGGLDVATKTFLAKSSTN